MSLSLTTWTRSGKYPNVFYSVIEITSLQAFHMCNDMFVSSHDLYFFCWRAEELGVRYMYFSANDNSESYIKGRMIEEVEKYIDTYATYGNKTRENAFLSSDHWRAFLLWKQANEGYLLSQKRGTMRAAIDNIIFFTNCSFNVVFLNGDKVIKRFPQVRSIEKMKFKDFQADVQKCYDLYEAAAAKENMNVICKKRIDYKVTATKETATQLSLF